MSSRFVRRAVLLIVLLAVAAFGIRALTRPARVEVVRPVQRDVVELVVATGFVRAGQQADLGADIIGVVESVLVREGDQVAQGEVLLTLRRKELDDQIAQLRSSLERSQRELERVNRPAFAEDVTGAQADLAAARQVNESLLDAARERLRRLEAGGRIEERRAAEAALRSAAAAREVAESELSRAEQLFSAGAISSSELERKRTVTVQAQSAEESARQQVSLTAQPAREEDIAAAGAEVRAAEARLRTSVRAAQARLDSLLSQPRIEDVAVARARVQETAAALRQAQTSSQKTVIRAPFSGKITKRMTEPGQSVNPGQVLLSLADMRSADIRVETDEANLPQLRIGQIATVFAPSYRDEPFEAALVRIGPRVDKSRGVIELELAVEAQPRYLRPDMTVDVNLETARLADAIAVPASSVLSEGDVDYVLVVSNERLSRKGITVLARNTEWVAVEGLSKRDAVALRAAAVDDAAPMQPVEVSPRVR